MATKLVCDQCGKVINEPSPDTVVRGNGDFHSTFQNVYISGSFRLVLEGQGEAADVCVQCVKSLLTDDDDLNVRDGTKVAEASS